MYTGENCIRSVVDYRKCFNNCRIFCTLLVGDISLLHTFYLYWEKCFIQQAICLILTDKFWLNLPEFCINRNSSRFNQNLSVKIKQIVCWMKQNIFLRYAYPIHSISIYLSICIYNFLSLFFDRHAYVNLFTSNVIYSRYILYTLQKYQLIFWRQFLTCFLLRIVSSRETSFQCLV